MVSVAEHVRVAIAVVAVVALVACGGETAVTTVEPTVPAVEPPASATEPPPSLVEPARDEEPTILAEPVSTALPRPAVPPASAAPREEERSIDDLLESSGPLFPERPHDAGPPPPPGTGPPPTRRAVTDAFRAIGPEVHACAGDAHGRIFADVVVSGPTGQVSEVHMHGDHEATPLASCIAHAIRQIRFEPFANPTFAFSYPFNL